MDLAETSSGQFESQRQFVFQELQRLIDSYNDKFFQLHHTVCYVDSLRKENLLLASEKLKLLSLVQEQERSSDPPFAEISSSSTIIEPGFDGNLQHANLEANKRSKEPISDGEVDTGEEIPIPPRNFLPKSISIRSNGFLTTKHLSRRGRHPFRLWLPGTTSLQDNGEVEVEAYNQGATKTELCNKWGEMGMCPYAEHCQFAHGVEELRPVIRHPRYKTQLCRMLNSGGGCPYGHRCHFRHAALTPFNGC